MLSILQELVSIFLCLNYVKSSGYSQSSLAQSPVLAALQKQLVVTAEVAVYVSLSLQVRLKTKNCEWALEEAVVFST